MMVVRRYTVIRAGAPMSMETMSDRSNATRGSESQSHRVILDMCGVRIGIIMHELNN